MQIVILGAGFNADGHPFPIPADDSPALIGISMHYLSPGGAGVFDISLDAGPALPDVWPLVERAAVRAQQYLDACLMDNLTLIQTLMSVLRWMDKLTLAVPGQKAGPGGTPCSLEALMGLLILRSFGLAADDDDDNGFVAIWYREPKDLPVLTWHGTDHGTGHA